MTPQDIERIARDTGEIAFSDGKYILHKGDAIMSPDALAAYTAQVLEEVARELFKRACRDGAADRSVHGQDDAEHIRTIAASLGGKDGG
jgi:hypothetical protein